MRFVIQPAPHPARANAIAAVREALPGQVVEIRDASRSTDQNAKFHAICGDLAASKVEWMGRRRRADQWKVLLVSGHAIATKQGADMVPGLEGEFVNLRESTARMSKARASSLIEYAIAWQATHDLIEQEIAGQHDQG